MPLADSYSYPVLGAFWTIFELFLFVVWIWLLFWIFADIFRSRDMSGWSKALWTVFVLVIPVIGILCYLVVRGGSMHERAVRDARQQDEAARAYIRDAAGRESPAEQLTKLAALRDQGVISAAEFEQQKAKVLASTPDKPVPDPRAAGKAPATSG
jgi:Short C-terminal domain/Phospholipase_D-nuclease N-terminal